MRVCRLASPPFLSLLLSLPSCTLWIEPPSWWVTRQKEMTFKKSEHVKWAKEKGPVHTTTKKNEIFIITNFSFLPQLGQGLVIPFFLWFFWWSLAPDFRSAKKLLARNIFLLFARIFMKLSVENHWQLNGIKIPSTRAGTKRLTSFESHRFDLMLFLPLDPSLQKTRLNIQQ